MHPVSTCVLSIDSLSVSSWASLRLYIYLGTPYPLPMSMCLIHLPRFLQVSEA